MKPVRTVHTSTTFELVGGTRENDLPIEVTHDEHGVCLRSVWELTPEERRAIGDGANVYLVVWGTGHPPVAMGVSDDRRVEETNGQRP